ncbi:IS110 family transposase [Salipiger manganoxidans]|uniref:IS110 family transposase n=1 Tax=Salipiger marinus TaxID=555512 RepID=UPI001E54FDAA|nr:IS110 family transposase [Salipiger manganoxidans]MCD1620870.1 IS110 family transposase [Salipiger manganoxidans]
MDIKVLGIDLGKTVCSLAGLDEAGAVVFRKRLQRHRLLDFLATLPPCVVAMEACGGAHHIGRFCLQKGHEPRLMSPLYVRPYVKVHKNDDRDAEAIAEAATRPTMSFVAIKSEKQLDLQALHRARERLVSDRTRLINQGRGFLMERGIRVGTGRHVFQKELARLAVEGAADLSPRMLLLVADMASELDVINDRVAAIDTEIKALARTDADMQRLMEIPRIGPTIATALVAAVGTGSSFGKGRDLAAWLGLVPRQVTTGGKAKLIGISKHGNRYLRKLFIHGARTVLHLVRDRTSPITAWADALKGRAHVNVAAVAMANKMARIAWAVLTKGERYRPNAMSGL